MLEYKQKRNLRLPVFTSLCVCVCVCVCCLYLVTADELVVFPLFVYSVQNTHRWSSRKLSTHVHVRSGHKKYHAADRLCVHVH